MRILGSYATKYSPDRDRTPRDFGSSCLFWPSQEDGQQENSAWRGTSQIPLTHGLRLSSKLNKHVDIIIKVTARNGVLFSLSESRGTEGHAEFSNASDEDTDRKLFFFFFFKLYMYPSHTVSTDIGISCLGRGIKKRLVGEGRSAR